MNYNKYILSFAITMAIFITAFLISESLAKIKFAQIREMEENMSINILSLETQFDLLQGLNCEQINEVALLSEELNDLSRKLAYMEKQRGMHDEEVLKLKRRYSLLQIKDLLLIGKVSDKCGIQPTVILYFYSNAGDCKDCEKQGYVLNKLRTQFDSLRIYSFDVNLKLEALNTLKEIHKIKQDLPALVINGKTYAGFRDIETVKTLISETEETMSQKSDSNR